MKFLSFFSPLFTFRFVILAGIAMGIWLYSVQTEQIPLSALLTETRVYLVLFLIALGFHLLLWIIVQKASLYDIGGYIFRIIRDTIVITLVTLSTVSACFLIHNLATHFL